MELGSNVILFDISNRRVKDIKVDYVWFTVGKKRLLCTLNEYNQNFDTISQYMTADSSKFGTLNAESVDNRDTTRIREYHNYLFIENGQISKVVSSAVIHNNYLHILLILNLILVLCCRIYAFPFTK
jgi:hypothetical protein